MTSLVVRKLKSGRVPKLKLVSVVPEVISGGVLKLERVQVICPGCGQQVEAVATDGQVKGYCAVANQYVDFQIETQLEIAVQMSSQVKISAALKKLWQSPEYRAKMSAALKKKWQDPEYRAKQIAACTGRHLTAETRAKISAASIRWHSARPSVSPAAKRSSAVKKLWQDPEYRAKQIAAKIGRHLIAETRAKISAALTRRHSVRPS